MSRKKIDATVLLSKIDEKVENFGPGIEIDEIKEMIFELQGVPAYRVCIVDKRSEKEITMPMIRHAISVRKAKESYAKRIKSFRSLDGFDRIKLFDASDELNRHPAFTHHRFVAERVKEEASE